MLQFVFFCENASVAAANKEISVELADESEEEVSVVWPSDCSGEGEGGGVGYPVGFFAPFAWNILTRLSKPRTLGTR